MKNTLRKEADVIIDIMKFKAGVSLPGTEMDTIKDSASVVLAVF